MSEYDAPKYPSQGSSTIESLFTRGESDSTMTPRSLLLLFKNLANQLRNERPELFIDREILVYLDTKDRLIVKWVDRPKK